MMGQAIEQRRRHLGIAKSLSSLALGDANDGQ